jgi:riboflavin kinase/FMN adenylyltransferase
MHIARSIEEAAQRLTRSVVTIGNFDGVHLGHQWLITQTLERAAALDASPVVLTFEPHPVRFFKPDAPEFRLMTLEARARELGRLGIPCVVALPFDEALANMSPQRFFDDVLRDGLRAQHILVGQDFHFGHKRSGTPDVLRALCEAAGVGLSLMPPVQRQGWPISSTTVRAALREARMDEVRALLGRPWSIEGEVVHGDARGRTMGFPTANVACDNPLMPPDGIFITTLTSPTRGELPAITYIGQRPTFGDGPRTVETFVLHYEGDSLNLYGEQVRIDFHRFLRPDARFDGMEALMAQMERDVAQARQHFGL